MQVNIAIAKGHDRFITVFEDHAFAFTTSFFHSEVIVPQYHILRWGNDWFTVFWIQDVLSSQHQDTSFCLSFFWKRYVDGHLVPVKVGIIGFTDKWVQAKSFPVNQDRFKSLDPQTVKGRCAVQENWVFFDHFF